MSDEARTIMVVTDDPSFSGQLSELLLRAGVGPLRFALTRDALELARNLVPDLVLIHIPRGHMDAGKACYERLLSDSTIASLPVLLYAAPVTLTQPVVRAPGDDGSADRLAVSDMLIAQIGPLLSTAPPTWSAVIRTPASRHFRSGGMTSISLALSWLPIAPRATAGLPAVRASS